MLPPSPKVLGFAEILVELVSRPVLGSCPLALLLARANALAPGPCSPPGPVALGPFLGPLGSLAPGPPQVLLPPGR